MKIFNIGRFLVASIALGVHAQEAPAPDSWAKLEPMPVPVHGVTGAAFINGLIYLPGSGTALGGASGTTLHQVYRPKVSCR